MDQGLTSSAGQASQHLCYNGGGSRRALFWGLGRHSPLAGKASREAMLLRLACWPVSARVCVCLCVWAPVSRVGACRRELARSGACRRVPGSCGRVPGSCRRVLGSCWRVPGSRWRKPGSCWRVPARADLCWRVPIWRRVPARAGLCWRVPVTVGACRPAAFLCLGAARPCWFA